MRTILLTLLIAVVAPLFTHAQTIAKVEAELLGRLEKLEKASNYTGTRDYEVLAKENEALRAALVKYGTRSDVLTYGFAKLKPRMTITTSKDGKLRTYSWDTEEGGTMHDFMTVYQYRGKSGKARAWAEPYVQSMEGRGAGAYVSQIFQIAGNSGPIYLTVSNWIGSTSLSGQIISGATIDGEKLNLAAKVIKTRSGPTNSVAFEYDFFSVVDRPERPVRLVYFDDAKKSFRFPIVIQDKKTPQGRVTNRFITYRYDGKYFVKVS